MGRIIIARHGNTFDKGDIVRRVGARTDMTLSHSGRIQAHQLKKHFSPSTTDWNFERAYCSSLRRTRETAQIILEDDHIAAKIEIIDFLTEIDYGIDENKPEEEVLRRLGSSAIAEWDTHAIVPNGWSVDPQNLIENWRDFLSKEAKKTGDTLVVTSNGIARFVLSLFPAANDQFSIKLKTGAYGTVFAEKKSVTLVNWNQTAD